jgi:cation:H+ antiporter
VAKRLRMPPLVIALTVVAFGTSAPELFVGIMSSIKHTYDLSVGNLLGSSFADITLVLGIAALIRPIRIKADFLRREFPFVIVAGVLIFFLSTDGMLTWGDGVILILTFAVYLYYTLIVRILEDKLHPQEERIETAELKRLKIIDAQTFRRNIVYLLGGLFVLTLGAYWLIESAVAIATSLHIPQLVIGVTLISIGTVMPEFITSIVAAFKGDEDIQVGNSLGSLIFNVMFLFGIFAILHPITIPSNILYFELPALLSIGVLLIPLMRRNFVLGRFEGALLVLLYIAYTVKQFWF